MSFTFQSLDIQEVKLIRTRRFTDARGFFMMTFKQSDFLAGGVHESFVQDNFSHSVKDVLRGLHYQKDPMAQGKLVMVLKGRIYDVAVDIRRGSPTYGRWVGAELSDNKAEMLYVPPGFAHGFCVLSDEVDFTYKVTAEYAPAEERGIRWNDPSIGIEWPVADPLLSERDKQMPLLEDADNDFQYDPDDQ